MTAIRLEVVVECPDWDALDEWHLRENLPIPTERLDYIISRSHISRCDLEFVDTETAHGTSPVRAVRDEPGVVACHRPGSGSTRSPSP